MSLDKVLREQIHEAGPLPFDEFMEMCQLHPEFGYYSHLRSIGRDGDFVTAPEISQMFGEMLGIWVISVWMSLGKPTPFCLTELGPGQGTLMSDGLRAIRQAAPDCLAAAEVWLLEASQTLKAQQQVKLQHYSDHLQTPLHWISDIAELPKHAPLIVIANEFFDALPIQQYVFRGSEWRLGCVGHAKDGFCFVDGPAVKLPREILPELRPPEAGDVFEMCPAAQMIAQTLAHRLCLQGGAAALIDYGHDRSAYGNSLQAVSGHLPVPVLSVPGISDMTAHVDFEALIRAASSACNDLSAQIMSQRAFLKGLGIETRAKLLMRSQNQRSQAQDQFQAKFQAQAQSSSSLDGEILEQCRQIERELSRLIDESAMGVMFKACLLVKNQ